MMVKKSATVGCLLITLIFAVQGCELDSPHDAITNSANHALSVVFDANRGTVTANPSATGLRKGDIVQVQALPGDGFRFIDWTGTIESADNPLVVTITRDESIQANFGLIATYRLTTETNPIGGTVNVSEGDKRDFRLGETCELRAIAANGFRFERWDGDYTSTEPEITLTFDRDYRVTAVFTPIPEAPRWKIDYPAIPGGTVTIAPNAADFADGDTVAIQAIPDPGYLFGGWEGDASGDQTELTLILKGDVSLRPTFIKRKWTFIVYMSADNNLESYALQDLNELEATDCGAQPYTFLILLDRGPGYEENNQNWTDTRLLELRPDTAGINASIVSRRIACPKLGITADAETELNLADPLTLSLLVDFAKSDFSAENYGIVFWGHGTGWKSTPDSDSLTTKGFAIDDTSSAFMSLPDLGRALAGKGLGIVCFDTCFGSLIETAYQLRSSAQLMIASAGAIPATGWDYSSLIARFNQGDFSAASFRDSAVGQFASQYATTPSMTISAIDLTQIEPVATGFDALAKSLADEISDTTSQRRFRDALLSQCRLYQARTYPSDCFIDLESLCENITTSGVGTATAQKANDLRSALSAAIPAGWSQSRTAAKPIGAHLIRLMGESVYAPSHEAEYVRGSSTFAQGDFVRDFSGWVPSYDHRAGSLLDKLFYALY